MLLEEYLQTRPVDPEQVAQHKEHLCGEIRAYKLRELRKNAGLSQVEVASCVGVSQRQISKIENGDIENSKISTIRKYVKAVGGHLSVEYITGDTAMVIA